MDAAGNVYVADTDNHTIRKISVDRVVTTVAGVAGQQQIVLGPLPGSLSSPNSIVVIPGAPGKLIVSSGAEDAIVQITLP